jgi:hypothetical protein
MADVLMNGREPVSWELPSLERGRRQELERDTARLAGVLAEEREDPPPGCRTELLPPLGTL